MHRVPWLTLAVLAVSLGVAALPGWRDTLIFDRAALERGEWWRWWTGHAVHFGWSHWFWNVIVVLPAGAWAERRSRGRTASLYLSAPAVISALVWWLEPGLRFYAGLSGVAVGAVVLLALLQLRAAPSLRGAWPWWGLLVLVAGKLGLEVSRDGTLFAGLEPGIVNVALAHLGGALVGAICALGRRR